MALQAVERCAPGKNREGRMAPASRRCAGPSFHSFCADAFSGSVTRSEIGGIRSERLPEPQILRSARVVLAAPGAPRAGPRAYGGLHYRNRDDQSSETWPMRRARRLRLVPQHRERGVRTAGAGHARAHDRPVGLHRDPPRRVEVRREVRADLAVAAEASGPTPRRRGTAPPRSAAPVRRCPPVPPPRSCRRDRSPRCRRRRRTA